ncbi:CocE/NonD family hydrolase [Lacticaseibacillus jixiensis]|uniref:CocE/NonD family hydrolase n=1 Tax=Lacticaseibacillus jixiensis TaxID=3231926 RepID=UPI0036F317C5
MSRREELIALLGKRPKLAPSGQVLFTRPHGKATLETLALTLNDIEQVPAYFAYPNDGQTHPLVIFNHSHGGNFALGKDELIAGNTYLCDPPFLDALLAQGYAVGCIDMFAFGERQGFKEEELVKSFLITGRTVWGMRLFDNMQFVSYLSMRPEVDPARIATIGMSMGGMMSWWLAALDPRIKVCVDIAGQVDLETLMAQRGLGHHGFYYYVPSLLEHFSTQQIQELIVPKARLSLSGRGDVMCPIQGVQKLDAGLQVAYAKAQQPDNWRSISATGGHQETAAMRAAWLQFMQVHL